MNIFYLSRDPVQCARWHVDKHVQQMMREYSHLLSIAHRLHDGTRRMGPMYRFDRGQPRRVRDAMAWRLDDPEMDWHLYHVGRFEHNVCAIWTAHSLENYQWLYSLFRALHAEYQHRFGSTHDAWTRLGGLLARPPRGIARTGWTSPYPCMHPRFEVLGSILTSYRECYRWGKNPIAVWTARDPPPWYMVPGMQRVQLAPGKTGQPRVRAAHPLVVTELTPRGKQRGIKPETAYG